MDYFDKIIARLKAERKMASAFSLSVECPRCHAATGRRRAIRNE